MSDIARRTRALEESVSAKKDKWFRHVKIGGDGKLTPEESAEIEATERAGFRPCVVVFHVVTAGPKYGG
ncbi:MAG: hypothetical protein M5R36_11900 [Deltaproteobacteria bacterium]|nr:hypothetical protein [Deltaproteobacteria bacterium]